MTKQFDKLLRSHEKEDETYIRSEEHIVQKIYDEFANADEIIALMKQHATQAKRFFDSNDIPMQLPVIPIRKSDTFYIKKHTLTQKPYYHGHDFYEMLYVHKGKCIQNFYPDAGTLTLTEKQLYWVVPGMIHALQPASAQDIVLKIVIPKSVFRRVSDAIKSPKDGQLFDSVSEQAEYFICKIMQENLEKQSGWELAAERYLSLLLIELSRTKKAPNQSDLIEKLQDYLCNNLKHATLQDFARSVDYNSTYLSRIIKQNTASTFSDLLQTCRLQKAKQLLEQTDLTIENISAELGFANPSGFYKQFCATFGMTPKKYRQMFV